MSSFGISGTNAHVILEQGPERRTGTGARSVPEPAAVPWVLSASGPARRSPSRPRGCARVTAAPADVGWSLATGRAALEERAVVVGTTAGDFAAGLADPHVRGRAPEAGRAAVLFSGQGSQRAGMGGS